MPKQVTLDRTSIRKLLDGGYSLHDLEVPFVTSRQWISNYLNKGVEPRHPGITLYINFQARKLLEQLK